MQLSTEKQHLLAQIVPALASITGVEAVVLGGSHARGRQHAGSDLDIGIYYHAAAPFSIDDIRRVAGEISTGGPPQVTDFYGWGAWVNGGAWIATGAGKVDFLYRNLEQVERTIADAAQHGVTQHDYNQQPAFGFYSVIYLGETQVCIPLHDPHGKIARLKAMAATYPPALKAKTVQDTLWLAEFSLLHAAGYARHGDVYTTVGALARTAGFLTQALFALNETYFMNDKTAQAEIADFALRPPGYTTRLAEALACVGRSPEELSAAVGALHALWGEVVDLTGGAYRAAFQVL